MSTKEFEQCLKKSLVKSLDVIEQEYSGRVSFSSNAKDVVKLVNSCKNSETIQTFSESLSPYLYPVLMYPVVTPYDREIFFEKFHHLKLNTEVRDKVFSAISFQVSNRLHVMFYQVFLRKLVEVMLAELIDRNRKEEVTKLIPLSETEQQVLYYIAGFIVSKLKKNHSKSKSLKDCDNLIKIISTSNLQDLGFLQNVSEWTSRLDRGGLQYPTQDFYLLIREMENITNSNIDMSSLSAHSLLKVSLKELVMDSFLVKYYWTELLKKSGSSEDECGHFLEYVIDLFLTIRGFAVARKVKNQLHRRVKPTTCSLRKSLQK